jgi:hypothetical protein
MKYNRSYLLLAIVIILVIAISLCCSTAVLPYSSNDIFTKEYPYEGFTSLGYTDSATHSNLDNKTSYLINGDVSDCKKVYGFDGLFCKPGVADSKIDPFGETHGDSAAFGASSGLSNSMGSIVLSKEQLKLLQTRGGNQTGAPAEIGSK